MASDVFVNKPWIRTLVCWGVLGVFMADSVSASTVKPFDVRDDIELAQVADVITSPNEEMVVVHTWRASLQDGKLHDELRFYNTQALRAFVNNPDQTASIKPTWVIDEKAISTGENGPPVTGIRWFDDGSGVAFLLRTDPYHRRLCFAQMRSRDVRYVTSVQDDVLGFSVRDALHYAFTIASHETQEVERTTLDAPFQVATGKLFMDAMFPEEMLNYIERGELWAAMGGPPGRVNDQATGLPILLYEDGSRNLSLSPDGATLITVRPLAEVPKQWEDSFPPPYPKDAYRIRAGKQNLNASNGWAYVGEYVSIKLGDGKVISLTNAPYAERAGWWEVSGATPRFSDDGKFVLLPGTFLLTQTGEDVRPCVAAVELASRNAECVRTLKRNLPGSFEPGFEKIAQVSFLPSRHDGVLLKTYALDSPGDLARRYIRSGSGAWSLEPSEMTNSSSNHLLIESRATFKDSPVLVASDSATHRSRVVFDLNPQLRNIVLGVPELYQWKDAAGRDWQGILYKPLGYQPGAKYPLVIQNHGFALDRYVPSGGFPSAFVAQELASAGIAVLHVRDCNGRSTPIEGPCNVGGYEAAVAKLAADGLVDPSRVGIIGFSRTVFYVLEALTTSKLHFAAASVTEGITAGYMDYLLGVGSSHASSNEETAMMGAPPFGTGLELWLKGSPDFNMDKVTTPLRVVATRSGSLLEMWEPYALLEDMQKPVDLIILNSDEHIITNPAIRLAAQTGNLDWFRFWLQGYEDPDPSKAEQYARWREFKKMQLEDDRKTREQESGR